MSNDGNNLHFINHEISCHYLIFILCLLHVRHALTVRMCIRQRPTLSNSQRLLNGQLLAGKIHLIGLGGLMPSCDCLLTELSAFRGVNLKFLDCRKYYMHSRNVVKQEKSKENYSTEKSIHFAQVD